MAGINIDITAKQLIVGVISTATGTVALLYFLMTSYVTMAVHNKLETRTKIVEDYKITNEKLSTATTTLLNAIKAQQDTNFNDLDLKISDTEKDQLNLRRRILKTDISKITTKEKTELREIEEFMVSKGYLNPNLITKFD